MKRVFSLGAYCSLLLSTAARETVFDCSRRSLRFALDSRLVRRRLRTEERLRLLLVTTAARVTQRSQLAVRPAAARSGG
jgi:hypothetical protein